MKKYLSFITRVLQSRVFWNIFFWVGFLGFWLYNVRFKYDYPVYCYFIFRGIFWLLMMILSYVNNLFLVPRLLARRKYLWYVLSIMAFTFLMSFLVALNFNIMQHLFPRMGIGQVSYITTDIPLGFSFDTMVEGASNYYFFLLSWVCIFTMTWFIRDNGRQAMVIEESRRKQTETELTFLKNQLNPHFLFNTLNNLYSLALKKSDSSPDAILKLSSILRYLLYESNVKEIAFEKEKEIMQAYIGLELLRLTEKDNLNFSIVADKDYNIPPLLWLPVLENVFKHGTRYISEKHSIDYTFTIKDNILNIHAKNEFKIIPGSENGDKSNGIGLANLRKRLELLFSSGYTISTNREGNHYITDVMIKL